jgi:hypothetical protein
MTTTTCTYLGTALEPCGCASLEGKNYCATHYPLVYQAGTARARRKKELRTVDKVRIVETLMNEAIAELEAEGFDLYGQRELGGWHGEVLEGF